MKYYSIIIFLFFTFYCKSQIFSRNPDESLQEFAEKYKPDSKAISKGDVLETSLWYQNKKTIFCFYKTYTKSDEEDNFLQGYLFLPLEANKYKRILIDSYYPEGNDASIESIFFANVDKDADKELIIICKWPQKLALNKGNLFQVFAYDNFDVNAEKIQKELVPIQKINNKFKIEFDGYQDGKKKLAKYNTAAKVRARLKQLISK
jgi:hypothetical protein